MRMTKVFLTMALGCTAAFAFPASGLMAQSAPSAQNEPATIKAREQATNLALLGGLVRRRFAIAEAGETEANGAARAFLDQRIAELRKRLGN